VLHVPPPKPTPPLLKCKSILESGGHPTQLERLRSHGLAKSGKLSISPTETYDFTADDLVGQGEIGHGNYGTVDKMFHERSGVVMAVKRIRSTIEEKDQKQLLMDLDVVMRSNECPYIVKFYGALFKEGDCWICMELMSTCLDQFYRFVHGTLHQRIPEDILGKITFATLQALNYLKENLKIIHRDVKPSNILLDTSGNIKMCDFGISGQLVDSVAKTRDAGCRPYMAPERIDPHSYGQGYDVRSDVWSLGITLIEVSTGRFPYRQWHSIFDQLTQVVEGEPPHLDVARDRFSPEFVDFVNTCLIKDYEARPKYDRLLKHIFVQSHCNALVDVAGYVTQVVDQLREHGPPSQDTCNMSSSNPPSDLDDIDVMDE
jgi:mitogen-activated protein kinase kinase 4